MLTGPELGAALKEAMRLKGVRQAAVAAHFKIAQPSVSEWIRYGRIGKQHIPTLVSFFADVVGPEHWGLPVQWGAMPLLVKPAVVYGDSRAAIQSDEELDWLEALRSIRSPAARQRVLGYALGVAEAERDTEA